MNAQDPVLEPPSATDAVGAHRATGKAGDRAEPSNDIPIKVAKLRVGERDPWLGEKVGCLIEGADRKWIVFLNEEWSTLWYYTRPRPRGYSEIAARVAQLESIPTDHLSDDNIKSFRVLVGQGMARVFDDDGPELANVVLDQAEEYVGARLAETSRLWYVLAGLAASIVIVLALTVSAELEPEAWRLGLLTTGAAGLGACASLLARRHKLPNDPNAGWLLHAIEAMSRIGVGLLSGWLVLLAAQAEIILSHGAGHAGLVLIAFAAGATERFVPDLVARVGGERIAGSPKPDKMSEAARTLAQNRGWNNRLDVGGRSEGSSSRGLGHDAPSNGEAGQQARHDATPTTVDAAHVVDPPPPEPTEPT